MTARRLVVALVSAGLSVALAEAYLRTRGDLFDTAYRPSSNPRIVYELVPGKRIEILRATISSQGLNDREFALERPPGVLRIAVLGDSTSFGWRVEPDRNLAKVLERELNALGGARYEVLNFSVPGYNTSQEAEVLRERVLPFRPDLVVLVFNENDVRVSNWLAPSPTWLGAIVHRSYLATFVVTAIDGRLARPEPGGNFDFPAPWIAFKRNWLGAHYPRQRYFWHPGLEETEYEGGHPPGDRARVPERYWYMVGYDHYRTHLADIRNLLDRERVPLVSTGFLTPEALAVHRELGIEHVLTGLHPEELGRDYGAQAPLTLENDPHYSELGHELAARRILAYLLSHGLVARESQPRPLPEEPRPPRRGAR